MKHYLMMIFLLGLSSHVFGGTYKVGQIEVEKGAVLLIRENNTSKIEALQSLEVFNQDTLQTLPNSSAKVILGPADNADQFLLAEKTTFVIQDYVTPEERPTRGIFSLLGGKLRSIVNTIKGKKDIQIQTGNATIGVKGTDFLTEVPNDQLTQVTTFEGTVSLKNRLGALVEEVFIRAGTASLVVSQQIPFSPVELSRESLIERAQLIGQQHAADSRLKIDRTHSSSMEEIQTFRQKQFNSLIEEAARTKGSLLHIKIQFPHP